MAKALANDKAKLKAAATKARGKGKPKVLAPLKADSRSKGGKAAAKSGAADTPKPRKAKGKAAPAKPRKTRAATKAAVDVLPKPQPKQVKFQKHFVAVARRMFLAKVTDKDIAETLGVDVEQLEWWKEEYPEFGACFRADPKNYGGRPTEWDERNITIARKLAELGATDLEVAQAFEVSIRTIHRWKLEYPEFREALEVGKNAADKKVEDSLYKRAVGYSFDSEKIVVVNGEPERVEIIEHVPPDTKAAMWWLQNRQPGTWRDVKHIKHDVDDKSPIAGFLSSLGAKTFAPRDEAAETRGERSKPNQIMPKGDENG